MTQGVLIDYDVSLELGEFLDRSAKKLISFESLKINGKPAFERQKNNVELFDLSNRSGESAGPKS